MWKCRRQHYWSVGIFAYRHCTANFDGISFVRYQETLVTFVSCANTGSAAQDTAHNSLRCVANTKNNSTDKLSARRQSKQQKQL